MKIDYHKKFQKNYLKRIKSNRNLDRNFKEKIVLFVENSNDLSLKDHALTGKLKHLRSFSITGDIRVIYQRVKKDTVLFLDVGTHNQIY